MQENNENTWPKEAPHFFTEVAFEFLPEISYEDLIMLAQLVKLQANAETYSGLRDALRKIQWAKISALEAIGIEKELSEGMRPDSVPFWPVGMARHAKAMMECVMHSKAALDSMAVFLRDYFKLPFPGGRCDVRHQAFRNALKSIDGDIAKILTTLEPWIIDLVNRRDMWIHRSSPAISLQVGPSEVGILPVPKELQPNPPGKALPSKRQDYWSTEEFANLEVGRTASFFTCIVKRCIAWEKGKLAGKTLSLPINAQTGKISFFPMKVTENLQLNKISYRA